jgi:hypothetical protein
MNNEQYLASCGVTSAHIAYSEMLATMAGYEGNKWWLSDDARVRAYYQVRELDRNGRGFYDFGQFQRDLSVLLGRSVFDVDIATRNMDRLRQEVEQAWKERSK